MKEVPVQEFHAETDKPEEVEDLWLNIYLQGNVSAHSTRDNADKGRSKNCLFIQHVVVTLREPEYKLVVNKESLWVKHRSGDMWRVISEDGVRGALPSDAARAVGLEIDRDTYAMPYSIVTACAKAGIPFEIRIGRKEQAEKLVEKQKGNENG